MIFDLPLEIIEKIIISNNYVLTNYNIILNLLKTFINTDLQINRKRKRDTNETNETNDKYINVYHYLLNYKTINNIYKHSGWYNYFIKHKSFINHQKQFNDIVINFNLLKPLLLLNNDNNDNNDNNNNDNNNYNEIKIIENIDKNIDTNKLNLLIKDIVVWWNINSIKSIDTFILLIIILTSGTMFNNQIKNLLTIKFIEEDINININNDNTPCYFKSINQIIPLFQKHIDMGYSFNIAWDLHIEKCIGFLYGGPSAEDYYIFDTSLKTYLYKNKSERLNYIKQNKKIKNKNQFIKMLLIDDKPISVYEKYCINYM
jgi:hypothetical protein